MYRGKLTRVMPIEEVDEEMLGEYMTGSRSESAA
jgi:hypothetical protein